jgi:hypothetical protein
MRVRVCAMPFSKTCCEPSATETTLATTGSRWIPTAGRSITQFRRKARLIPSVVLWLIRYGLVSQNCLADT